MIPKAELKKAGGRIEHPALVGASFEAWDVSLDGYSAKTKKAYQENLARLFNKIGHTTETYYAAYKKALDESDDLTITTLIGIVQREIKRTADELSNSYADMWYKSYMSFMNTVIGERFEYQSKKLTKWRGKILNFDDVNNIPRITKDSLRNYIEIIKRYSRNEEGITRDIALLHTIKDSGLSRGDVIRLNVSDVSEAVNELNHIESTIRDETDRRALVSQIFVMMDETRAKTGNRQYPVLGPESIVAIRDWLQARTKTRRKLVTVGGTYAKGQDNRVRKWTMVEGEKLTPDSALFIYVGNTGPNKKGDRLQESGISSIFNKINVHIENEKDRYSPHSLRKYNWFMLEEARVPKNWASFLQGRKIKDSSGAYTIFTDKNKIEEDKQKLLEAYIEAYDFIKIEKDTVSVEQVKAIEEKAETLTRTIIKQEQENQEIQTKYDELAQSHAILQGQVEMLMENMNRQLGAKKQEPHPLDIEE